ncbi:MAG: glycosyltransferase family 4 protein [Gammaproteobacteria bacterium]|nr:glycosyltransferase family 4 protein [Gammaproteobacteria bacterium]
MSAKPLKLLLVTFDQRDRHRSLVEHLRHSEIVYELLDLSNKRVFSSLSSIRRAQKDQQVSHTIFFGLERVVCLWMVYSRIVGKLGQVVRLGGDPFTVPRSRHKRGQSLSAKQKLKFRFRLLGIKIGLRATKSFICVSKTLMKIPELNSKNSFVVPTIPRHITKVPRSLSVNGPLNLLTVTNLNYIEKYEGVLVVIEAARKLSDYRDVHLKIAGGGRWLSSLRQQAVLAEGENLSVDVTGFMKNISDCYSAADIFVYHSTLDSWPNVLIEAMSVGLPIVVNKIPEFEELLGMEISKNLCGSGDSVAFATRLALLSRDTELYQMQSGIVLARCHELLSISERSAKLKGWLLLETDAQR